VCKISEQSSGQLSNTLGQLSELWTFVYGTLKPGGRYHPRYCEDYLTEAVPALVRGYLYDFPQLGYPALTLPDKAQRDSWVSGYVLKFSQPPAICTEILQRLDRLEGYDPRKTAQENDYERCQLQTFSLEQQPLRTVWGYVMTAEQVRSLKGIYLPTGNWPVGAK